MKELSNFIKMFLAAATIILSYVFASIGIVELFWNTNDGTKFQGRVIFVSLLLLIVNIFLMISSYHILGDVGSTGVYNFVMFFNLAYLLVGNIYHFFIKTENE